MAAEPTADRDPADRDEGQHAAPDARPGERPAKTRSKVVKPGRMPVSEVAFDRPGAGSPFGDDIELPVPVERLTYEHPDSHDH